FFFFSSRRRHTRFSRDWSSDVCSSDLDRVDIFCPLLGNRCTSVADLNAHLEWIQGRGEAPLMGFQKAGNDSNDFGKNTDADFSRSEERRVGKECRYRWSDYE